MPRLFNVIGVVSRTDHKQALELAKRLIDHLETKEITFFLEPQLAKHLNRTTAALPLEGMKPDLIITIGGDGTILRTCLALPKPEPPILAINMGVRGFLTEVSPKEGIDAVDKCLEGKFSVEHHMKLASVVGDTRLPDALNEVFITSPAPAKILYAKIWKDDVMVAECRADGIVIASQVGSTGYSLSGGGPVLDPELDAFVLTPICPLTVFYPIVFPTKSRIKVELLRPKKAILVLDGHLQKKIEPKRNRITITKSEHETSFIRFKKDFYHRLKGRRLFPKDERIE
ncbi:MAG: NAD(+)/NADH kinase [Candidatus Bathyarchaeota archaeon]|nr:NAD(+)/NADH kinase [Candidatus Bathyarchaeota archaeon]MDH5732695.1 NAD(+)/NADH kinase [Candidatus Bathyarchaeota archaeon]